MAQVSPYGRGFIGLLKKGWDQIPGVMGSTVMGSIGFGVALVVGLKYHYEEVYDPKYKRDYIVCRSDDPRLKRPTRDWI